MPSTIILVLTCFHGGQCNNITSTVYSVCTACIMWAILGVKMYAKELTPKMVGMVQCTMYVDLQCAKTHFAMC